MMPFNLTFRRLLQKYVPQLSEEDINRYESLTALRTHIYLEDRLSTKVDTIEEISKNAQKIIEPVEKHFDRTTRLWRVIREYSLVQGNLLQVPPTIEGLSDYIKKLGNYRWTQATTLPFLWINKAWYMLTHLSKIKTIPAASVPTLLIILGLIFGDINFMGAPIISGIPDQTIKADSSFQPIKLDEYVSDPNHADSELKWTFEVAANLKLSSDSMNRVVTIDPQSKEWTGSDTIIFIVTDPSNFSDSDTAVFTIENVEIDSTDNQSFQ